jgi:hypothetical protein
MAADAHKNAAISVIATAPSPASSGTSLVVTAGEGARFPLPPFNATVWPPGSQPTYAAGTAIGGNFEIVRVTAVTTDTLTIVRTQENTAARVIAVGDQLAATITVKTLTDAEASYIIPITYTTRGAVTAATIVAQASFQANTLVVGKAYRFRMNGIHGGVTTEQAQIYVGPAGTTSDPAMAGTASTGTNVSGTTSMFVEFEFRCTAVGTSGTLLLAGSLSYSNGTNIVAVPMSGTQPASLTVDTTVAQFFSVAMAAAGAVTFTPTVASMTQV